MSIKLRELIRNVRACKTAAEERSVIAKECARIRTDFKDKDSKFRHRNVAKLLYIQMLGYPTHFGQMESLKLIASNRFPEKRIGYLGLMLLLDENQEVLMLVTNSLKIDMNNDNQYVAGLALCSLGNICTADMARDLSGEVEKILKKSDPYLRKKAALCAVRFVRKVPDLVEDYTHHAINLLSDKSHAVLLTGITLIIELIHVDPSTVKEFRKLVPTLVKILKAIVLAGYVSEYDVMGITDPFLQCRIIHLLRLLGKGTQEASDEMSDILAQVAINTDAQKTPANAILYESVQTIMSIEAEEGLRVLAVNILGRFLLNRDNNIRYVALNTLCKVVQSDIKAIQRHRAHVVECLKDPDSSIRKRALDLIYALVTKENVRQLVKELLNYLGVSGDDNEFMVDLTDKICFVVGRYAPSKRWHIDTLIQVLLAAGSYTRDQVYCNLIGLISRAKSLHAYCVHKLYRTLIESKTQELSLVNVAVWSIGEYGEYLISDAGVAEASEHEEGYVKADEKEVVETLAGYLDSPVCTETTKGYIINSLLKLSARFKKTQSRLMELLKQYKNSMSLELQQRSIEYTHLMASGRESLRDGILMQMPMAEVKKSEDKNATAFSSDEEEPSEDESGDESEEEEETKDEQSTSAENQPAKPTATAATFNILEGLDFLTQDVAPAAAVSNGNANGNSAAPVGDILDGLFGMNNSTASNNYSAAATSTTNNNNNNNNSAMSLDPLDSILGASNSLSTEPANKAAASTSTFPTITTFEKNGLSVTFSFKKPASDSNSSKTQILATFYNSTDSDFNKFDFKVAVPKYIRLQLKPATSPVVPAKSRGKVTQLLQIDNSQHGQKKLQMRLKIDYEVSGQPVTEQTQVSDFPPGV